MPRLFTALPVPPEVAGALARLRGGLPGARWMEPDSYHVTLRFVGDVDGRTAHDLDAALAALRPRGAVPVVLDALAVFGGAKPRALVARIAPDPALARLAAEHERVARESGLEPETRRFTPHVTLARLRGVSAGAAAGFIASAGLFPRLAYVAPRAILYSARDSVGGGPYLAEADYALESGPDRQDGTTADL